MRVARVGVIGAVLQVQDAIAAALEDPEAGEVLPPGVDSVELAMALLVGQLNAQPLRPQVQAYVEDQVSVGNMEVPDALSLRSRSLKMGHIHELPRRSLAEDIRLRGWDDAQVVARLGRAMGVDKRPGWNPALSIRSIRGLKPYVSEAVDKVSLRIAGGFKREMMVKVEEITQRAAARNWDRGHYRRALRGVFESYLPGMSDTKKAAIMETWYRTHVLNGAYNLARDEMMAREPTRRLYPYAMYRDSRDPKVRPNHRLNGFVAAVDWEGWATYTPPMGWNCRCYKVYLSWKRTRELGIDPAFTLPFGLPFLRDGSMAPGYARPDPGFPSYSPYVVAA